MLAEKPVFRASYIDLVIALAIEERDPTADEWNGKWLDALSNIAGAIGGAPAVSGEAKAFLKWPVLENKINRRSRHSNATIHSVKGETHTATLVMETYFRGHHLASLMPWLMAKKAGRGNEGVLNISRLKQHYVAMTRPSHLLCLAMREDAFTAEELTQLKNIPWRVARVTDAAPVWL